MTEAPMKLLIVVLAGFLAGTFVQTPPQAESSADEAIWQEPEAPPVVYPDEPVPLQPLKLQSVTIQAPLPLPPLPIAEEDDSRPIEVAPAGGTMSAPQ
jgi:hypothetical protein